MTQFNLKKIEWCKTKIKSGYLLNDEELDMFTKWLKEIEDKLNEKCKEVDKLKKKLRKDIKENEVN